MVEAEYLCMYSGSLEMDKSIVLPAILTESLVLDTIRD